MQIHLWTLSFLLFDLKQFNEFIEGQKCISHCLAVAKRAEQHGMRLTFDRVQTLRKSHHAVYIQDLKGLSAGCMHEGDAEGDRVATLAHHIATQLLCMGIPIELADC